MVLSSLWAASIQDFGTLRGIGDAPISPNPCDSTTLTFLRKFWFLTKATRKSDPRGINGGIHCSSQLPDDSGVNNDALFELEGRDVSRERSGVWLTEDVAVL